MKKKSCKRNKDGKRDNNYQQKVGKETGKGRKEGGEGREGREGRKGREGREGRADKN